MPEDDPLANMPEEAGRTRPIVVLRLRTDSGIEGIGVTLYGARMTRTLHAAVEELAALTVGEDPMRIEAIVAKLRAPPTVRARAASSRSLCRPSTPRCGTSRARRSTSRLWKLLGGHRDRVPTYASGSLRRGLTDKQAQQAARS